MVSTGGKIVAGGQGYELATIDKRDDGFYWIQTKVPVMIDTLKVNAEAKLTHGCKIVFLDKYYAADGSNILIAVYSKAWIADHPEDQLSNQPKSIFQPKRVQALVPPQPMEGRIVHKKWNFEEREHMK